MLSKIVFLFFYTFSFPLLSYIMLYYYIVSLYFIFIFFSIAFYIALLYYYIYYYYIYYIMRFFSRFVSVVCIRFRFPSVKLEFCMKRTFLFLRNERFENVTRWKSKRCANLGGGGGKTPNFFVWCISLISEKRKFSKRKNFRKTEKSWIDVFSH